MLINTSSSPFDVLLSLHHANISFSAYMYCLISRPSSFIFTLLCITNTFLLLPLCIFILYHGLQQWRHKRSTSSAATMSHSDSFTYHMVIMELISVCGSVLFFCGIYSSNFKILVAGGFIFAFTWYGQMFFHILTCLERYLAVVHPIIYLSLRKERGIRIRNISIGCVWLLCFVGLFLVMKKNLFIIMDVCLLISSFIVISFCSLSVLYVLIKPGPGNHGGIRERVGQLKLRAFYTILVILGTLVGRFAWNLSWVGVFFSGGDNGCVIMMFCAWFNLPCSLMLPLLFLHREGKLVCCKNNIQSG